MKTITFILLLLFPIMSSDSFKTKQKSHERVSTAYEEKEDFINTLVNNAGLDIFKLNIYLRAFKKEAVLEVWAKNNDQKQYNLLKLYEICASSGDIGPKRKQGDLQVPEGYYRIDRFNPWSNFHLSLGINYPNKSDKILSNPANPGGDIFIHGNCVTIGCLPLTDDKIKELYILCVESRNNGQEIIPVTIFPNKLNADNYNALTSYHTDIERLNLWEDLKSGYDIFNETKQLPSISFLENGRHIVSK